MLEIIRLAPVCSFKRNSRSIILLLSFIELERVFLNSAINESGKAVRFFGGRTCQSDVPSSSAGDRRESTKLKFISLICLSD